MQLAGFGDGIAFLAGVHNKQRTGELLHVLDAAQILLQLGDLALELDNFLLGQHGKGAVCLHLAQLGQTVHPGPHGLKVGEHTAQPTSVDIVHAYALSLFADGVLSLLLGADEQQGLAIGGQVAHKVIGLFQLANGLLQVNDIDTVALRVDVRSHFRVPAAGLMSEMDASLQQLLHGYDCHCLFLLFGCSLHPCHLLCRPKGPGSGSAGVCGRALRTRT